MTEEIKILGVPLITINKNDNTKFDVGSYKVQIIDTTDPLNPVVRYREVESQIGIKVKATTLKEGITL